MIEIEVRKDRHRLEKEKYGERTLKENVDKLTNALLLICSALETYAHFRPLQRALLLHVLNTDNIRS